MKKILIIFLLGVFAVTVLVSCAEDDAPVYVESTEVEATQTEHETAGADTKPEDTFVYQSPVPFELSGSFMSSTGTPLNLIIEYSAQRKEDQSSVSLIFDLFIEHKNIVSKSFGGKLTINGKEYSFVSPFYDYKSTSSTKDHILRIKTSVHCGYEEDLSIDIKAEWDFVGNHGGRKFDGISFEATLPIGEKYANLPSKISYDMKNILQRPELPEGCEVTSLAITLKDLGFDVSHTYLADNYLEQGQLGKVTPYEMNIGNPREEGKSWGCYSPVIVKTANKYLSDMKSDYTAFDYAGHDVAELYYQLSLGHKAIVWVTMDFAEPYLKTPWQIGGETFYWKYPQHCVVLCGYDMEKGTVTLTDPLKNAPDIIDMDTFELRFKQMGSQAVIIKATE